MPFDLDLSQVNPLLANVRSVFTPAATTDILLNAGRKVGVAGEGLVSPYPRASGNPLPLWYTRQRADGTTYKSKFKSMKQQRKVMMLAKQGKIPYRRSGQLGKSILSRATADGTGAVIVAIGSNLTYAPYVIDAILQSHYHMVNWQTIQADIAKGLSQLTNVTVKSIVNDINKRISNG